MSKQWFVAIGLSLMVLTLAACSGDDKEPIPAPTVQEQATVDPDHLTSLETIPIVDKVQKYIA